MTLEYLKNQIWEELMGADEYMSKALECKGTNWGNEFLNMASGELTHVSSLIKMVHEYYADPDLVKDVPKEVWDYTYPKELLPRIYDVKAKVAAYKM